MSTIKGERGCIALWDVKARVRWDDEIHAMCEDDGCTKSVAESRGIEGWVC